MDLFEIKTNSSMGYNKWVYPKSQLPIVVNTSMYLVNFGSIDEPKAEYTIQLILRFEWLDERLKLQTNKLLVLEGGQYHLSRIWSPSIHMPSNKDPDVLQANDRNPVLTRISSDGRILVSKRIVLNGLSEMDFTFYPLDKQYCDIAIESNELSDTYLRFQWTDDHPFDMSNDFNWNGFVFEGYNLKQIKSSYSQTGTFSKLVATFMLRREFGQFILDIYVPSIVFVVSSWTSFWVDVSAAPARATLGLTPMLTLVTSAKTARDKLPSVSYIHALDIWILMCTFFIFASLVEYATVNYIYHKDLRKPFKTPKPSKQLSQKSDTHRNNIQTITKGLLSSNLSVNSLNSSFESTCLSKNESSNKAQSSPISLFANNESKIINGSDGGIELIVPNIRTDNESVFFREDSHQSIENVSPVKTCKSSQDMAYDIDRMCRYIFPISFLLIIIIYWVTLILMT